LQKARKRSSKRQVHLHNKSTKTKTTKTEHFTDVQKGDGGEKEREAKN